MQRENVQADSRLEQVAVAVSEFIDKYTGRSFEFHDGEVRYHVVQRGGVIEVVDLIAAGDITLAVDSDLDRTYGTTVGSDSFLLEPLAEKDGSPAVRAQRIIPWTDGDDWMWLKAGYLAKITADWGWDEEEGTDTVPPDGIKLACLMLVARWYKRREAPMQVSTLPAYGFRRVLEEDTDAKMILEPYVHPRKRRLVQ